VTAVTTTAVTTTAVTATAVTPTVRTPLSGGGRDRALPWRWLCQTARPVMHARTWRAQERGAALSDPAPAACTLLLRPPESMPTPLPHVHRCGRCPANTSYQPCCAARLLSLSRMYPVPCTPTPEVGPPRTPPTHATWTTRDRTRRAPRPCTQGGARTSPRAHPNPANTPPAEVGPRSDLDAEDALHLLLASDLA